MNVINEMLTLLGEVDTEVRTEFGKGKLEYTSYLKCTDNLTQVNRKLKTLSANLNKQKPVNNSQKLVFDKDDVVRFNVVVQGAIQVNNAILYVQDETMCAIIVDCKSKRGDIIATGNDENDIPILDLGADEETTNIKEGKTIDDATEISFPDFKGWDIFTCNYAKYSIYVSMYKRKNYGKQQRKCN